MFIERPPRVEWLPSYRHQHAAQNKYERHPPRVQVFRSIYDHFAKLLGLFTDEFFCGFTEVVTTDGLTDELIHATIF